MPREHHEAVAERQKLRQRVRAVHAKQLPTSQQSLETVITTIREQYDQEQSAKRTPTPTEAPGKAKSRQPSERGIEP